VYPISSEHEGTAILDAEGNGGEWTGSRSFNPFKRVAHPKKWSNTNGSIAYLVGITRAALVVESPKVEEFKKPQAKTTEEQQKENIPKF